MLKHPKIVIALVLGVTLFFAIAALSVVMDNDLLIFFPDDNPSYLKKLAIEDEYGSQILMDICITTEEESLLTWANLDMIDQLTREFSKLDYVQDVTGLTNTDFPVGTDEGMAVSTLLPEGEERTAENLIAFKARLLDWSDAYRKSLYSDNFKSTQLIVKVSDKAHSAEIEVLLNQVRALIEPYNKAPLDFRIAGDPVVTQTGKEFMYADLRILIPFVALVLFLSLFLAFRKFSSALLPLITVLVATVWTVGTMALAGVTFTIISSCLPVLIIAVGSAYGIHVINHYYHTKTAYPENTIADNLKISLIEVRQPIALAGVTTTIGFLSILTSPIVPMKDFGLFAAVGTAYSLALSFILVPILLEFAEKRRPQKTVTKEELSEDEYSHSPRLLAISRLPLKYKIPTTVGLIILAGLSTWGVTQINVESSLINNFPKTAQIRKDSDFIDENFGGTNTFNVILAAEEGYDLTNPEALKAMDDLKGHLEESFPDRVGKIISYSDFIKRMNQVMNYPSPDSTETQTGAETEAFAEESFSSDEAESDSFFADSGESSFFEGDSGFDNLFDTEPAVPAGEVTATFASLSDKMDFEDFITLINNSYLAHDKSSLTLDELSGKIKEQTNYRGSAYYEIPWDVSKYPVSQREELSNLISQYLLLYSGSLDEYANDSLKPTEARMFIQLTTHGSADTEEIIDNIDNYMQRNLPDGYTVSYGGIAEMQLALTKLILKSQLSSIFFALIVVFLIIMVTYKSPLAGLIGIVPLSLSIVMNFGLMSVLGINLDMVTAIIASISIGIGVDYTVHFMDRYKMERAKSDDLDRVTTNTILSTGRGILINALSVGLGFAVLILSRFMVLRYIGGLVAIIMVTSSLGALIILPLILNHLDPTFMKKSASKAQKRAAS